MPRRRVAGTRRPRVRRSRRAPAVPEGMLLGAHMSIAGGLDRAVERAYKVGCTALQIFTKSSNQWRAKELAEADVSAFLDARRRYRIDAVVAHDSYLINLASPDPALFERSVAAFRIELLRCECLGIPYLVFHPGAHVGAGEAAGIDRVVAALNRLHRELPGLSVRATVETTAGQGTCLGHSFDQLAAIIARVDDPGRVAVCMDTCHVLAAGYEIRTAAGYERTMAALDAAVGLDRVAVFHLNDSKKGLGSRVDRHEWIGCGAVGDAAFRFLLNDPRLSGRPLILETPKGTDEVRADTANLRRLVAAVGVSGSERGE